MGTGFCPEWKSKLFLCAAQSTVIGGIDSPPTKKEKTFINQQDLG